MSIPEDKLELMQKELQWITVRNEFSEEKASHISTLYKILVPIGTLITTGVLGKGIYYMLKRNSEKQQLFMRYRVFAQGLTVCVAAFGLFHVKLSS